MGMNVEGAPALQGQLLVEGRYRVGFLIGGGGFAWVYRGYDTKLEREIALKVLKPRAGGQYPSKLRERFELEARMTARLQSLHTVTLHDFGEHTSELGTYLFMVFEFVDGITLSEHLRQYGKLTPLQLAVVLQQVLGSLQEAHKLGFVHRDIKSPNIMLYTDRTGRENQVKVLDYGIGKATESDSEWDHKITATDALHATPAYAAPEQLSGDNVGPSTDLYALGMVAYEALLGEHPYAGKTLNETLLAIVTPAPLQVPHPHRGTPLAPFIDRLLQKDIVKRFANCEQALAALEALQSEQLGAEAPAPHELSTQRLAHLEQATGVGASMPGLPTVQELRGGGPDLQHTQQSKRPELVALRDSNSGPTAPNMEQVPAEAFATQAEFKKPTVRAGELEAAELVRLSALQEAVHEGPPSSGAPAAAGPQRIKEDDPPAARRGALLMTIFVGVCVLMAAGLAVVKHQQGADSRPTEQPRQPALSAEDSHNATSETTSPRSAPRIADPANTAATATTAPRSKTTMQSEAADKPREEALAKPTHSESPRRRARRKTRGVRKEHKPSTLKNENKPTKPRTSPAKNTGVLFGVD